MGDDLRSSNRTKTPPPQEFWITGDCNGRGTDPPGIPIEREYPDDHDLFLQSAERLVRSLRNRPSVALWCGGNEQTPPPDVDFQLRLMLGVPGDEEPFDGHPGAGGYLDSTRVYVPGSLWAGFAKGDGAWSDGPYGCQARMHPRTRTNIDFLSLFSDCVAVHASI